MASNPLGTRQKFNKSSHSEVNTGKLLRNVAISLVLLAGLSYIGYVNFFKEVKKYDEVTGCPLVDGHASPIAHTVVVIDKTDTLTDLQRENIEYDLANLVKRDLRVGELLSIYSISDDFKKSRKPIFEMCKIRDGSDASKWDENERKLREKFNKKFKQPLQELFVEMMSMSAPAKQSPIFEIIQSVSVNTFKRWNVDTDSKIILYSDMLHNTPEYSLYKMNPNFEKFRQLPYASNVKTRLPGTEIHINMISTRPEFQKSRNIDFWRAYFRSTGATVQSIVPIGR